MESLRRDGRDCDLVLLNAFANRYDLTLGTASESDSYLASANTGDLIGDRRLPDHPIRLNTLFC